MKAPVSVTPGGGGGGGAELASVTGLSLSPDGQRLLAFSMDHCLRAWDVRPFASGPGGEAARCLALYRGARNNFEMSLVRCAWSGDGERVACGSADRLVRVWDAASARLDYALPGHAGAVLGVAMHPSEPVIASGGADKRVLVGELGVVEAAAS